jgi:membrane-associated phospholipid phosphatase
VVLIAVFYGFYTLVRDLRGTKPVSVEQAFTNARRLIHLERILGIFHEAGLQKAFLSQTWLIRLCDDFYGTIHFVAAIAMLVVLFVFFPGRYRLWRNTIFFATGLALVGFYFFPLMPPRLLPPGYHFVDTLKTVGGLWSFSSGPVNDVSNQYAAMPSLHTAWSAWCALVLCDIVRPWWGKALAVLYPAATIFAIVVTANHYFGDVIAGLLLLAVSYLLAKLVTTHLDRTYATRRAAKGATASVANGATASVANGTTASVANGTTASVATGARASNEAPQPDREHALVPGGKPDASTNGQGQGAPAATVAED